MLLNRRGWSNFLTCRTCGKTWECPQCDVALVLHRARERDRLPPLRPPRAGAGALRRVRLARRRPPRRRHRADRARAARGARRAGVPARRRHAGTKDAVPELLARFRAAPEGLLLGTQMVAKGHDFPDVDARRRARRRLDAALPRLPRRGAHVRADRPARRAAPAAGRRGGRVLVQTSAPDARRDRGRRPPRRRGLPGRRAGAPPRARLPAVRGPDPRRLLGRGRRGRPRRGRRGRRRRAGRPAHRRARPGAAVPPARPRALPGRGQDRASAPPRSRATGAAVEAAARDKAHRDVAFSVDVDPQ